MRKLANEKNGRAERLGKARKTGVLENGRSVFF